MDPQLLKYYSEELIYMRSMANEFAASHPKIAKRLGMQGIEIADPYVERLIEAFCFLSARMRIKLDAEFPNFTQRLLEVIYPNYISPTPSMAVAQFHPDEKAGDLTKGFKINKHTSLFGKVPESEQTACEFRTSMDVTLWPIEITEAKLAGIPPDLPSLSKELPPHIKPEACLRFQLQTTNGIKFSEIKNLDNLPIYLCGNEQIASHLYELLLTSSVATFLAPINKMSDSAHAVTTNALVSVGMALEDSLLPCPWSSFHGHNLIHEYFANPNKFYFVGLQHLSEGFKKIDDTHAELIIILTKHNTNLMNLIDKTQFALYCSPIINLFPKRTDRVEVNSKSVEHHIIADRSRPMDFEIFSIEKIVGQVAQTSQDMEFRPLFQTLRQDEGNHGRYFSIRREARQTSDSSRKYGTRTSYVGSEAFISLVDQSQAPYSEDVRYLSVQALLTNRDLPRLIPRNGLSDLSMHDSAPIKSIGLIRAPSSPIVSPARGELAWKLIRQLGFNHIPLHDLTHRDGAKALREMLNLFVNKDDKVMQNQINGLISTRLKPVVSRIPGSGPLVYGRGVECELTIDEDQLSGISPFLLGSILQQYFTKHVSVNTFTQTKLTSIQRGDIHVWPPIMGARGIV
jgi:type VI secretion system protein ImpG